MKGLCYYIEVVRETTKYPGVAKFGIALEWGSRGLEFESRHSDQKSRNSFYCFCFFLCFEIRKINPTVRWTVACRQLDGGNTLNFLLSKKKIANESRHSVSHPGNIYSVKQVQIMGSTFWYFPLFLSKGEIRTSKCGANERRWRRLDGATQ